MNKSVKTIIGCIMVIIGIIAMLACCVTEVILQIQNPDMTELRLFIEYPAPTIIGIISFIIVCIGKEII